MILNILFLLKVAEIIIPEMKAFRDVVTLTADGVHQHNIRLKRLEESHSHTFTASCVLYQ